MTHQTSASDDAESAPRFDLEAGRRAFMQTAGLGGAMAAFAGAMTGEASAATPYVDVAILNFALNLEYLEGEYYQRSVYGVGLPNNLLTGTGPRGTVQGGTKVPFQNSVVNYVAAEIANDEKNHINFIRSTLGKKAVAEPSISLDASFSAFAAAAGLPDSFSPYADDISFLLGAYILTEVGVTAYVGASAYITNKAYLAAAGSILSVEAYHIGTIRTLLFAQQSATITQETALISALRAKLSGAQDDQGIGADQSTIGGGFPSPSNITNTDPNSLNFARTPRQVLNVVYGKQGAGNGGFFPNGVIGGPGFKELLAETGG